MTDEEAVADLMDILQKQEGDQDAEHEEADRFVRQVLREHGFPLLADLLTTSVKNWWFS